MDQEKQRIVIANVCGHKFETKTICPYCKGNTPYAAGDDYGITLWEECRTCKNTGKVKPYHSYIPDYLFNLNAMHEAEKVLGDGRNNWDKYCDLLGGSLYHCAHATAAQRAEAFLRTLNLWEE